MKRSVWLIVVMLVVSAVVGSGLSYLLAKIFPSGPVYNVLCKVFSFGIRDINLDLGFINLTFGLTFSITGLAILFIILAVILLVKF